MIAASFVYLLALIGGFSRNVIGYGLGRTLSAEFENINNKKMKGNEPIS
jgi:hypothetical protein